MSIKLSIIIVNYNVKYFLEHCLISVTKACANINAEIFVVDNNSDDGSNDYFKGRFDHVNFIWNNSNLGFATANNLVLPHTKGDIVLFLNPDTIVPEDCFEKCISFFNSHPECGALGVNMIDGNGMFLKESKRSFPTPAVAFWKMIGLHHVFPTSKIFAAYYEGDISENETKSVDVLSGAYLMISRKMLERVKGFDEDFFMYGEDIDLSYRIKKTGFKNFYFAETSIIHFKGESNAKNYTDYFSNFYGAMKIFVKKHYKENIMQQRLMFAAIALSKLLRKGIHFFKKITPGINSIFSLNNAAVLVVSKQQTFNHIIHLLKFSKDPLIISGRIAVNVELNEVANGTLDTMPDYVNEMNHPVILFCEADIPYKNIIAQMKRMKKKAKFMIHSNQSNNAIGSFDKSSTGIVISAEEIA